MSRASKPEDCSPRQRELLRWVGGLGAVSAEALAERERTTLRTARAQLGGAERTGLVRGVRVLAGEPRLYTATSAGLRAGALRGIEPCRVSAAGARHALVCALAAARLEHAFPDHRLAGERELRRDEREAGRALASACVGTGARGAPLLHRPDLVLWPKAAPELLPVAVEVELTVKAAHRLLEIIRGWARCGCVAGTVYLAGEEVVRPLARAIERARAGERIALVALEALGAPESFVPGRA